MAWALTESDKNFLDLFVVEVDNIQWDQMQGTRSSTADYSAEEICSYAEDSCSGGVTTECSVFIGKCAESLIEYFGEL